LNITCSRSCPFRCYTVSFEFGFAKTIHSRKNVGTTLEPILYVLPSLARLNARRHSVLMYLSPTNDEPRLVKRVR
jgi:hypothetical protein